MTTQTDSPETIVLPASRKKPDPLYNAEPIEPKETFFDFPLDLTLWKHLTQDVVKELTWFHAVAIDQRMTRKRCEVALGYDWSTIFRVYKGQYTGSYQNFVDKIRSHRKVIENQGRVTTAYFVKNSIYEKMDWIFDYTLARKGCSMVVSEAGVGKTVCAKQICSENNHGTSVLIECLPIGGPNGLLKQLYEKCTGAKDHPPCLAMFEATVKSLNPYRIVVFDEFHLHLPEGNGVPRAVDMARRIRDLSGCAMMFIVTHRFEQQLQKAQYMFEQFTGRTGKPFFLPKDFSQDDLLPIVTQFIKNPTAPFMDTILQMANDRPAGRLRHVVETFEFATAIAHDTSKVISEKLFLAAKKLRDSKAISASHVETAS